MSGLEAELSKAKVKVVSLLLGQVEQRLHWQRLLHPDKHQRDAGALF